MFKFNRIIGLGAGGVGYYLWLSASKVIDGKIPYEIWDPDTFEGSGGTRLPKAFNRSTLKLDLLKYQIQYIMGAKPPEIHKEFITPDYFRAKDLQGVVVVDCTDMKAIPRKELWEEIIRSGATLMRVSLSGDGKVVVSRGLPFWTTGTNSGGYGERSADAAQAMAAGGTGAMALMRLLRSGELTDLQWEIPVE